VLSPRQPTGNLSCKYNRQVADRRQTSDAARHPCVLAPATNAALLRSLFITVWNAW
jgi:hypothetical protein